MKSFVLLLSFLLLTFSSMTITATTDRKFKANDTASLYKSRKPLFLLVTGCARSGTTYISMFLRRSGIDVPHEGIGSDGSVSWMMAASTISAPYGPGSAKYMFQHTFHQIRNPLKSISSLTTESEAAWNFVIKNTPQIKREDSYLTRCAKYWIYWNRMAEKKAEWTYRIEDLPNLIDEMETRLGRPINREVLNEISTHVNGRPHIKVTWADLQKELSPKLFQKLQATAIHYGYPIEDPVEG